MTTSEAEPKTRPSVMESHGKSWPPPTPLTPDHFLVGTDLPQEVVKAWNYMISKHFDGREAIFKLLELEEILCELLYNPKMGEFQNPRSLIKTNRVRWYCLAKQEFEKAGWVVYYRKFTFRKYGAYHVLPKVGQMSQAE